MWRLCDLHNHTHPDTDSSDSFDASAFLADCQRFGLDVVAVTDHDHTDNLDAILAISDSFDIEVVPGVELSTDRGHVLALSPSRDDLPILREYMQRIGVATDKRADFDEVLEVLREDRGQHKPRFQDSILLIGAHVDRTASLLAPGTSDAVDVQIRRARKLSALEISSDEVLEDWRNGGLKGSHEPLTLIRGSDTHFPLERRLVGTWLYLPDITANAFRRAFAIPEASVRDNQPYPE